MLRIFRTAAILAVIGSTAFAQDFDKGLAAAVAGDFDAALTECRPLAERGDASARINLGLMYDNGNGVPQDDAEAVKWYTLYLGRGRVDALLARWL